MKNLSQWALSLIAGAVFVHAHASTTTISTGSSEAGAQKSAAADKSVVSYNSVDNSGLFGSSTNVAFRSTIDFGVSAAQAGSWSFRSGVDFSQGGAMSLDGVVLDVGSNGLWWNGRDNNSNGVLSGSGTLAAGKHALSIYGLESCCDGYQQAQFKAGNSSVASVSATDGLAPVSPVPELSIYAMLLVGLGLLVFTTGQKQPDVFRA